MTTRQPEFLSLNADNFELGQDTPPSPIQSHLDTLFAEFTRSRRRLSQSRSRSPSPSTELRTSTRLRVPTILKENSKVDLRALDYVSDYDSHLMCPICHVPFVEPVVLDCDHTFCTACFEEYRDGTNHSDRSQCPTCRAYLLAPPQKASRLIVNMCTFHAAASNNTQLKTVLRSDLTVQIRIAGRWSRERTLCQISASTALISSVIVVRSSSSDEANG